MIMTWPPKYSKIVLDVGDEWAVHSGGKAPEGMSLSVGTVSINSDPTEEDQELLAPYEEWVENNLGDDDDQPADV